MSRTNEVNLLRKFEELGAKYTERPTFRQDRAKVIGCMWAGGAVMELDGVVYHFKLWYHGADTETLERLKPCFRLEGIRTSERYYDIGWYCLITEEGIWLHKEGWFRNAELREHPLIVRRGNPYLDQPSYTDEEKAELQKLGLELLVKF